MCKNIRIERLASKTHALARRGLQRERLDPVHTALHKDLPREEKEKSEPLLAMVLSCSTSNWCRRLMWIILREYLSYFVRDKVNA